MVDELRPYNKKLRECLKTVKNLMMLVYIVVLISIVIFGRMLMCNKPRKYDSIVDVLGLCDKWE